MHTNYIYYYLNHLYVNVLLIGVFVFLRDGGEVRIVFPVDFRPDYLERSFGRQTIGDFFLAKSL